MFKEILRIFPHHKIENWLIVQTFYDNLLILTRMTINASSGGALMNKNFNKAYALK